MSTPIREHVVIDETAVWDGTAIGDREVSIHVNPDVALHQRRGSNARRLVSRRLMHVASLAVGDALAAACAAVLVRAAVDMLPASASAHVPFAGVSEFCAAMLVALALTGNYQRSSQGHPTLHMLMASALGALVVSWSDLWGMSALASIPITLALVVATCAALFFTRGAVTALIIKALPEERRLIPAILISGDARTDVKVDAASGYRVTNVVSLDKRQTDIRPQELARLIQRSRAGAVLVVGGVRRSHFDRILEISMRAGCEVLCTPPGFGIAGVRATMARCGPYGLVQVGAPALTWHQLFAKRCVDMSGALAALVVSAPIWAIVAVAIRLDSPGPVLFSQERVGLGGRRFRMLKFRTMRHGADQEKAVLAHLNVTGDSRLFKIPDDPRVSRVGRFLRRWSIDELPQFLNVVMGHMSLVGPRPFFETDFEDYEEHHFRRLGAKPGITGVWQVSGRSSVMDFEEVVRMDTWYIDDWSLWLDLKILASTLPAVLQRKGAC
ncbi:MAG: exopolysaccharide biosynthesis polyprenyl glycosylphosphotransferase [Gemmatimonadaceae bacterium]